MACCLRNNNRITCVLHSSLEFDEGFRDKNFGSEYYRKQIAFYKTKGYDEVHVFANVDVGTYAWAKLEFEYADAGYDAVYEINVKFWMWMKLMGIKKPKDGWSYFRTPSEFANYRLPDVNIHADRLEHLGDVRPGEYEVGKAFMLDRKGHGHWNGILKLRK